LPPITHIKAYNQLLVKRSDPIVANNSQIAGDEWVSSRGFMAKCRSGGSVELPSISRNNSFLKNVSGLIVKTTDYSLNLQS